MFSGVLTALITPFREGSVDAQAFAEFVNWQITEGVDGVVACGTTGEGMLLTREEQKKLLKLCVKHATGVVNTLETLQLTQQAQECGVDAALIITPWYVKPSQESLYDHYKLIHDNTDLPILLYNNPGRTGVNLELDTIEKLAQLKRVVGLKDATSDLCRVTQLRNRLGGDFSLLAGDDPTYPAFLAMGGDGVISSAANAAPRLFVELQKAWVNANLQAFAEGRDKLHPFLQAMSVASNPQPVKFAASLLGNITQETRLPFAPLSSDACNTIRKTLKAVGAWTEQPSLTIAPA